MLKLLVLHTKNYDWCEVFTHRNLDFLLNIASRCYQSIDVPCMIISDTDVVFYSRADSTAESFSEIMEYNHEESARLCFYCRNKLPDWMHGNRKYCNPTCEKNADRRRLMIKLGRDK